jgi:hypothetical protein
MTLLDQIAVLEAVINGEPYTNDDVGQAIKSLHFLEKWEPEIRCSISTWKAARSDPAIASIVNQFPDAKIKDGGE